MVALMHGNKQLHRASGPPQHTGLPHYAALRSSRVVALGRGIERLQPHWQEHATRLSWPWCRLSKGASSPKLSSPDLALVTGFSNSSIPLECTPALSASEMRKGNAGGELYLARVPNLGGQSPT